MAVKQIMFDVTDEPEDEYAPYAGPDPVNGYYLGRIKTIEMVEIGSGDNKGAPMIKVLAIIEGGEYDGWPGWRNIPILPQTKFMLTRFLRALGKEKIGSAALMKYAPGKPIGMLVKNKTDQAGDLRPEVDSFLKPAAGKTSQAASSDDDEETTEPADEPDAVNAESDDSDEAEEAEEEDSATEEEGEDEPYTREELEALERGDLEEVAKAYDVKVTFKSTKTGRMSKRVAAKIIDEVLAAQEAADSEEEEDDEPPF